MLTVLTILTILTVLTILTILTILTKRLAGWGFVKLFMFLFVYLHWVACLWFSVAPGWYSLAVAEEPLLADIDPYILALQAAVHLTVGTSGLSTCLPTTTTEARIQTVILLCGACIVAGIFGNMAQLVSEFSAETANYHLKISRTMTQLKQMQVPEVVQLRARQYLEYTYDKHRWRTNSELYQTLSSTLARRIYAFSDRDVLRKAFLFTDSSEQFLNALGTVY
jgi:hypothetical protein